MRPDLPDDQPLVFLDVDGLLIPFKARPVSAHRRSTTAYAEPVKDGGNPLLDRLDPDDGRRLLALGCRLVWATTWDGCQRGHRTTARTSGAGGRAMARRR